MEDDTLAIIAGPCSVNKENIEDIYKIADIKLDGKPAIVGTRVVGLKSRTSFDDSGSGMGMDFDAVMHNLDVLMNGGGRKDMKTPPSVDLAAKIYKDTNMLIGSEIVAPLAQLPFYEGLLPSEKFMPWNPAVAQLGWSIMHIGMFAKKNNWHIGIKNGKWVGEDVEEVDNEEYINQSPLEKTWAGLTTYIGEIKGTKILIHRGVDIPEKGDYRNLPVHQVANRVKCKTGGKLFFDPSHAYGPAMRESIVDETVNAMNLKDKNGTYIYDGILIEAGSSPTDTEQHISVDELKTLVEKLSKFRTIATR